MEVLVIGGGVIGLSIAREMCKQGARRIAIVERGLIGRGASWAAAGMLAPNAETFDIDDFYRLCAESNKMYPRFAAELLDETGIDIEIEESGTLFLARTEAESAEIDRRFERQRSAGLRVERVSPVELRELEPNLSPNVHEALFFPDDRQVENRKLLAALKKYAECCGIAIHENVGIRNLIQENGRILGTESAEKRFFADQTILATGAWTSHIKFGDSPSPIDVKPVRGQMFCLSGVGRTFKRVIRGENVYLVPRLDGRILVGATVEDVGFDDAISGKAPQILHDAALEIAPGLDNLEMTESWCGFRPYASDGLPIIGPVGDLGNLFVATAHYQNGILLAPLTARIAASAIVSEESSPYLEKFGPGRFEFAAATRI